MIYVFECRDGHRTEREYRVADRPASVKCGCGKKAKRIITAAKVVIDQTYCDYDSEGILRAGNAEHRDFNERALASGKVKEFKSGTDHRWQVRPERIKELKQESKKCPPQPQS